MAVEIHVAGKGSVDQKNILQPDSARIWIPIFDGFCLRELALVADLFHHANVACQHGGREQLRYQVKAVSMHGGFVHSATCAAVNSEKLPVVMDGDSVVLLGSWLQRSPGMLDGPVSKWLAHAFLSVTTVASPVVVHWLTAVVRRRRDKHHSIISLDATANLTGELGEHATALQTRPLPRNDPSALVPVGFMLQRDLGNDAARRIIERVLAHDNRLSERLFGEDDRSNRSKVMEAIAWVNDNFGGAVEMNDICKAVAMTPRTLVRHFMAATGQSPAAYLRRVRFEHACNLLVTTNLPIDKVARRSGFRSGNALAKLFYRTQNMSAGDFRRTVIVRPQSEEYLRMAY